MPPQRRNLQLVLISQMNPSTLPALESAFPIHRHNPNRDTTFPPLSRSNPASHFLTIPARKCRQPDQNELISKTGASLGGPQTPEPISHEL
jgi:hypothetical protein